MRSVEDMLRQLILQGGSFTYHRATSRHHVAPHHAAPCCIHLRTAGPHNCCTLRYTAVPCAIVEPCCHTACLMCLQHHAYHNYPCCPRFPCCTMLVIVHACYCHVTAVVPLCCYHVTVDVPLCCHVIAVVPL